ncbi:LPXTG cell wall anchor domain-containing protein [Enterococcus casseliflavus]|uniref:LPXTG cell wall anchor domain-containing protein n=1 Tax=Enterococcus casseliflavus TaxID=37734 RepID=UPI002DB62339|nr:LPXTG cell wall anchor domain-containing protein [Enterococcus casseliflavus]MEB8419308.1 LPXTG cell wall anchor domain-containing protein [Enterococcus casseliflavus]
MFKKVKPKLCLLILCLSLCLPTYVVAETIDSHSTPIKVELKRNASEQSSPIENPNGRNNQILNSTKKKQGVLPQTGEIMNHWYSWLGVFLVILVSTLLYSKTQQKKK